MQININLLLASAAVTFASPTVRFDISIDDSKVVQKPIQSAFTLLDSPPAFFTLGAAQVPPAGLTLPVGVSSSQAYQSLTLGLNTTFTLRPNVQDTKKLMVNGSDAGGKTPLVIGVDPGSQSPQTVVIFPDASTADPIGVLPMQWDSGNGLKWYVAVVLPGKSRFALYEST